jgi:hypothetical protein
MTLITYIHSTLAHTSKHRYKDSYTHPHLEKIKTKVMITRLERTQKKLKRNLRAN